MKYLLNASLGQYPKLTNNEKLTLFFLVAFSWWLFGYYARRSFALTSLNRSF
jgi:hypothetical protein|tara:strand:- start:397 stop:552 length:156 start_codon:yes stop_codon:yes gene_type:complete